MRAWFRKFASRVSVAVGSPVAFTAAVLLVVVWAITGPFLHFSEAWQLTINTGTTIVTFWMVFLIQNTQNRDMEVMQLKLDELIRAIREARNEMLDLEDLSDQDLRKLKQQFRELGLADHEQDVSLEEARRRHPREPE